MAFRNVFNSSKPKQQTRQTSEDIKTELPKDFKECMPGNLIHVLNTKTGKLEEKSQRERLGFDPVSGKLGLITVQQGINTDNQIQLGMAEDGFFTLNKQQGIIRP